MILTILSNVDTSLHTLEAAHRLSTSFSKKNGIVTLVDRNGQEQYIISNQLQLLLTDNKISYDYLSANEKIVNIKDICEAQEVSFLIIQLKNSKIITIKRYLRACRELRIPYLFIKDEFNNISFEKIVVPVNFLIEEIEKAQFAAAFGRFLNSEIIMLQAKDYGSKAANNIAKISSVLDKFNLNYETVKGKKDSFKIEFDALRYASENNCNLIIASSSREYGLDDIVFGPKELHLIQKAECPLMLLNPRGDLYVLCD